MGPWHSPYRDGPNPELVDKFRRRLRTTALLDILRETAVVMRRVGETARNVGLAAQAVPGWNR